MKCLHDKKKMNFESLQKLNLDHKPKYKHIFIKLLVENIEEKSL